MGGVEDQDIAILDERQGDPVEIGAGDIGVGGEVFELDIHSPAHERGERQRRYIRPRIIMMVRTLTVCPQVARQIHDGVVVRNRSPSVEAIEMASPALSGWIERLGEIDDP